MAIISSGSFVAVNNKIAGTTFAFTSSQQIGAGQLAVLFRYVKGRAEIKKMWWSSEKENNTVSPKDVKTTVSKRKKNQQPAKPVKKRKKNANSKPVSK